MNNNCIHCDPHVTSSSHISERIEGLIFPVWNIFSLPEHIIKGRFYNIFVKLNKKIVNNFIEFLFVIQILQEVDILTENESLHNRTLILVHEARRRGFFIKSIKFLGKKNTNYFSTMINNRKIFFEGLPTAEITDVLRINFDNKYELKKLLQLYNLPHPKGECFSKSESGLLFIKNISFPLVVKPKSGSLSKHTTCNILDEPTLKEAIRIAQIIEREFIVEEFIEGDVHRITLVDGKVVASCLREPPNVLGDGKRTVLELVDIKNKDPRRGHAHQKNFTLHKIQPDSMKAKELLLQQGVSIETILPRGKKIYLHDKVTLSAGADIHDTTDMIHKDKISLFKKDYDICGATVIGIDFITKDISRSHHTERCAVIEVNSLPYIDMHHYPVTGLPRNVAGYILDYCISRG